LYFCRAVRHNRQQPMMTDRCVVGWCRLRPAGCWVQDRTAWKASRNSHQ